MSVQETPGKERGARLAYKSRLPLCGIVAFFSKVYPHGLTLETAFLIFSPSSLAPPNSVIIKANYILSTPVPKVLIFSVLERFSSLSPLTEYPRPALQT
jgi:hypothetical protein